MNSMTVIKNAGWIIGCKIVQAVLGLLITMFTARYLGPSNYGLINYAASIVAFAVPVMQLGLRSTLVQEFVNDKNGEGEILGTSLMMNLLSSFLCIAGVISFVYIANYGEKETLVVCALYSINLIFQALEMSQYWYQANLMSKYASITMLVSYFITSFYKIYILITQKSIYWFAISQTIDYMIISIVLLFLYHRFKGKKLKITFNRGKRLLSKSRFYIVSSLMVTVFAQTDRIMLKMMIDDTATGLYSAAVVCAGMTSFIFAAIIDSIRPSIFENKKNNEYDYERSVKILYSIIIYLSLIQCLIMTVFAKPIIHLIFGAQYEESVVILRVIVWYTTFSYIGPVRNIWILAEGKHKIMWKINSSGAALNVILNALLIPIVGVIGAAIASLLTQIFTNFMLGYILEPLRYNNKLIVGSMNPRFLIKEMKQICKIIRKGK